MAEWTSIWTGSTMHLHTGAGNYNGNRNYNHNQNNYYICNCNHRPCGKSRQGQKRKDRILGQK